MPRDMNEQVLELMNGSAGKRSVVAPKGPREEPPHALEEAPHALEELAHALKEAPQEHDEIMARKRTRCKTGTRLSSRAISSVG